MKTLKLFVLAFMVMIAAVCPAVVPSTSYVHYQNDKPAGTVVIKAGGAEDPAKFFSTTRVVAFEVFKPGSAEDLNKIVSKLKSSSLMENVIVGKTTGDYTNLVVTLKEVKDKAYWMALFKSAGLNHIKINNQPVTEVSKL